MDDITRYAPYLLLPVWLWIAAANLVAWRRTPKAEKTRRLLRRGELLLPGLLILLFFDSMERPYVSFYNLIWFYILDLLMLSYVAGYLFNRRLSPATDYRHPSDILLFRQPLPLEQQSIAVTARRPPQRAIVVSSVIGAILLVSVLGVSAQPCGWLDRLIQRSGCIRELRTNTFGFHDVRVSPDGLLVAQGNRDQVQIRRMSDGALVRTLKHPGAQVSLAFSADGAWLASGGTYNAVRIWQVSDGALLRIIPDLSSVRSVAFSPDSSLLATAGTNSAQVWRVSDGSLVWQAPDQAGAGTVAFFPNGQHLLIGDSDTIQIWQIANQQLLRAIQLPEKVSMDDLALSRDGTLIAATTTSDQIMVWQAATGTLFRTILWQNTLDQPVLFLNTVAFSPDGSLIATEANDKTARVWRVNDGKPLHTFWHIRNIAGVTFAPDSTLVARTTEGTLRLWKIQP